jgi:cell division protein FtsW
MESNVTPIVFNRNKSRRRSGSENGLHRMDFPLFITVVAIALFGIVMLFSASYYKSINQNAGNPLAIVKSQVFYLAAGIAVMFLVSLVPYRLYSIKLVVFAAYAVMIGLLLWVYFKGVTVLGAKRWVEIGGFRFQPSEIVKFIVVLCLAKYMTSNEKRMDRITVGFLGVMAIIALPCFLIYKQPNMSMLIIVVMVAFIMMFIGGTKLWVLLGSAGLAGGALFFLISVAKYRVDRFEAWLHPWENATGKSYQVVQSLYAFANGGFLGRGFNMSRQKLLFLPEMENDYLLSIIAEELGFVGLLLLIAAFFYVIYRGIRIAASVRKDRFACLLASGITATLAVQVLVNFAVVTNSIPSTGQTMPFISAGGSSLLVFFAAIGILLNISRYADTRSMPVFPRRREKAGDAQQAQEQAAES